MDDFELWLVLPPQDWSEAIATISVLRGMLGLTRAQLQPLAEGKAVEDLDGDQLEMLVERLTVLVAELEPDHFLNLVQAPLA